MMLKLILSLAFTPNTFMTRAGEQDHPTGVQPAPPPDGVIKYMVVKQSGIRNLYFRIPDFSPDGRFIAAAGNDGLIHLRDNRAPVNPWDIALVALVPGLAAGQSRDEERIRTRASAGRSRGIRTGSPSRHGRGFLRRAQDPLPGTPGEDQRFDRGSQRSRTTGCAICRLAAAPSVARAAGTSFRALWGRPPLSGRPVCVLEVARRP